jgi:hypothetical protein
MPRRSHLTSPLQRCKVHRLGGSACRFYFFDRASDYFGSSPTGHDSTGTAVQGLAVWRGAQARCDFAEALRFPAVLQCGAQQILQILLILLPSD